MHPTSATVGNGTFSYIATYDNDLRLSSVSENLVSPSLTLFSSTRTYDAVGNVATVATTLAAGTDNQQFCYDEQNRLVWAGSTGTPPCTGTLISAGSLTSAQYTASYAYDAMNRLTSAPTLGSYTYGTTPVHGATSTSSGGNAVYSASYDAVGDMVCRAPSSATTCVGTSTGQQMTYDAERRVSHWQSAPGGSPSAAADYLYDGSGNRLEQVDTSGGASTKVYYLFGGLEEVDASGSTSTLTKYYSAGGLLIGENVGGTISYLASDGLGSVSEALSTSGTVTAAQLYGPYGGVRYSSGTIPTAKGFTGQRADAISGLDYYGARYYDPVLGQFASADTKQGTNRFAYVADDPETLTDPTGHLFFCPSCHNGGGYGSYAPSVSYSVWQTIVRQKGLRSAHYLSPHIVRGTNASGADGFTMAAANNVANKQDSIGGVSTQRGEIRSYGEGVVEFWYMNDAGDPVLMDAEFTKLWLSDGDKFHAEWEVLSGNPRQSGRTVVSIIQDWLRQQGDSFDPSRWWVSVSIVTAYPTCNACRNEALSGRLYNTINNALGGQIGFDAELYGLNSARYRTGAFNPNKTYLNLYVGVMGFPDMPNYWGLHPIAWIPWWVAE